MRVLVVGAGAVGFHVAKRLSEEEQDVVVIDSDPARSGYVGDQLDVLAITGNGASLPILEKAGVEETDLLLAVTSKDEVNLIACLAASQYGVGFRVARISNPEYYAPDSVLSRDKLGVDLMINPERECAWETFQLLRSEAATDLVRFAGGRLQLMGLRVQEGARVAGKTLIELDRELRGRRYVTVAIVRDGVTEIPSGYSRILAGDQIYVLTPSEEMADIPPLAGYDPHQLRRVMIAGGSREAVYLARHLEEHDVTCTLLDADRERCVELAEELPGVLVLHADATDLELLEMEGVEGVDGFVAFTGHDETNMLSSLLAKTSGARKVISLIEKVEYVPLVSKVGVDAAVSPRMSTVNAILRYVRRGNVTSVATLKGIEAEAMELVVDEESGAVGTPLRELDLPEHGLLGAILRDDEVISPRGDDAVRPGDRVVVFTFPDAVKTFEALFG
jgi:trk system potassium uptake protein TrkA